MTTTTNDTTTPQDLPEHARLTLTCMHCPAEYRITYLGFKHPIISRYYCPSCGRPATIHLDLERDYWEHLATAYKTTPPVIRAAYDLWIPQEHPRFMDFMVAVMGYERDVK